jgi:hypothetical protein
MFSPFSSQMLPMIVSTCLVAGSLDLAKDDGGGMIVKRLKAVQNFGRLVVVVVVVVQAALFTFICICFVSSLARSMIVKRLKAVQNFGRLVVQALSSASP